MVSLNHTIIHASDKERSAKFLTDILGLPPHGRLGHFAVVQVGEVSLDFAESQGPVASRHFAFQVSEEEFDAIWGRIRERGLTWWADPYHEKPGEINRRDDGRGLYFEDPDGHNLEILTRPYGSGGLDAEHPHPLLKG